MRFEWEYIDIKFSVLLSGSDEYKKVINHSVNKYFKKLIITN